MDLYFLLVSNQYLITPVPILLPTHLFLTNLLTPALLPTLEIKEIYCYVFLKKLLKIPLKNPEKKLLIKTLKKFKTYDHSYSLRPDQESHSVAVFCALRIY